jgi:hypothetical protein
VRRVSGFYGRMELMRGTWPARRSRASLRVAYWEFLDESLRRDFWKLSRFWELESWEDVSHWHSPGGKKHLVHS